MTRTCEDVLSLIFNIDLNLFKCAKDLRLIKNSKTLTKQKIKH
jgi:hypothetical protein